MRVFVVKSDWAIDYSQDSVILGVFRKKKDAIDCMKREIEAESNETWVVDIDREDCYCACEDGFYSANHLEVMIEERELL